MKTRVLHTPPARKTVIALTCMLTCILSALCMAAPARAAELTLDTLKVYTTQELPALHTQGYYTPFKTLHQGSGTDTGSFLLVFADLAIAWDEPGTPGHPGNEEVSYTLADITLVDAQGNRLEPVGAVTPDLRAKFTGNLTFQKFTARQQWWHDSLRIGAVFNIAAAANAPTGYTLEVGNDRFAINTIEADLPDPAALLNIKVTSTELKDTTTAAEPFQDRLLPDSTVSISNPQGKLLEVAVDLSPQAANVEGGDIRYSFWTQDFMLNAEGAYYPVVGYIENSHFSEPGQINITPQGDAALGEIPTQMTLVFAVPENFIGGSLSYLGHAQHDISLTELPPGQ